MRNYKVTSSETWFDNKYLVKWTRKYKTIEVYKGPIHPTDRPIGKFQSKYSPTREKCIKLALRAIQKEASNVK